MDKKIVIIGAGASGIAAATKLIFAGFKNVVVLEAENRIGGRINTVPFGENVLDMGAQWCHGEKDNVVYQLAKNNNLLSSNIPRYTTFLLVRSDGSFIPQHLSDKLMTLAMNILDENEVDKIAYSGSLGNYFMERYVKALESSEYSDIDDELRRQFIDFFHKMENSIEASDSWYETSCKNYPQYWICDGDHLLNWKNNGYATVFDLLQKKIPKTNGSIDITRNVHYNKEVDKILYDKNRSSYFVQIKCSDGSLYNADHLICTVSLGVLKQSHLRLFEPHLPQPKIDSIDGLSIGTVDKIYLEFNEPFWDNGFEGFSLLWKPNELQIIRDDTESSWLEDVFGFYTINFQPNILCGWISGPNARRMEQATDEEVKNGATKLLRIFLKQWNIPEPKNVIRSKWYSNIHFRGSYSFYSLKSDANKATTTKLAEPIRDISGKPIVQFGGEATSTHYYSTVHGAIESGWREAKRLIDLYKVKAQL